MGALTPPGEGGALGGVLWGRACRLLLAPTDNVGHLLINVTYGAKMCGSQINGKPVCSQLHEAPLRPYPLRAQAYILHEPTGERLLANGSQVRAQAYGTLFYDPKDVWAKPTCVMDYPWAHVVSAIGQYMRTLSVLRVGAHLAEFLFSTLAPLQAIACASCGVVLEVTTHFENLCASRCPRGPRASASV